MSFIESLGVVALVILICLIINIFGGDDNFPDLSMSD